MNSCLRLLLPDRTALGYRPPRLNDVADQEIAGGQRRTRRMRRPEPIQPERDLLGSLRSHGSRNQCLSLARWASTPFRTSVAFASNSPSSPRFE